MKKRILKVVFVATIVAFTLNSNVRLSLGDSFGSENKGSRQVNFSLTGKNYKFTLPERFCTVSGKDGEIAKAVAALDSRNMTHFTIIPCEEVGKDARFTSWCMLKTPRGSIGKRIPNRKELIAWVKSNIKQSEFGQYVDDAKKLVGKTYRDVFGPDAKIGIHMELVGADEYAGYMVGTMSLEVAGQKELTAMAAAMTNVRSNLFSYYKYGPYNDLSDLAVLLKQAKVEIHRFVTDNPD